MWLVELDDAVRQEEAGVDVSLCDVCLTAISPRLEAILSPVPGAVAVVSGVVTTRSASTAGVGHATSTVPFGLGFLATAGMMTPLLAILGRSGVIPLLVVGAPLLGVQQLALL